MRFYRLKVGVFDAKCRALRGVRRVQKVFTRPVEPTYVFVLSPPYCGSTLMHQLLCTSPAVSPNNIFGTREGQALPEVRALIDYRKRWEPDYTYPWPKIKEIWTAHWAHHKPLLLDKSPPNLIRTQAIVQHFSPARFICVTRDPRAHVESLMRRNKIGPEEATRFSLMCLHHQKQNLETLPHIRLIRYEDLVADPEQAKHALLDFLPPLGTLDVRRSFNANSHASKLPIAITDLNEGKWGRIPGGQQTAIEAVFSDNVDVLRYFGYAATDSSTSTFP